MIERKERKYRKMILILRLRRYCESSAMYYSNISNADGTYFSRTRFNFNEKVLASFLPRRFIHVRYITWDGCIVEGCFFGRHYNIIINYQNFQGFKTKKTLKSVSFWKKRYNLSIVLCI